MANTEYYINLKDYTHVDGSLGAQTAKHVKVQFFFADILQRRVCFQDNYFSLPNIISPPREFKILIPTNISLIDQELAKEFRVLSEIENIEEEIQEQVVKEIGDVARKLVLRTRCAPCIGTKIRVILVAKRQEILTLEDDDELKRPATESSIEELERVLFNDVELVNECVICLDEIDKGVEVIRMPCSHVYHRGCIVKWLRKSHTCPLCRYEMPTEET